MDFNRCMGCMEELLSNSEVCPNCGFKKGTPPENALHLVPETILAGRYIIGKVLGAGGFGVTYLAWDLEMERKVAIKEYLPKDFSTRFPGQTVVSVFGGEQTQFFETGLNSFVDEAKRLAKFNSLNGIVNIYDSFLENETAYIVMEYLDGETLKNLAKREKKIPYQQAVAYIIPVLRELEKVHAEGIIHRDIAPDNIFLTKDGKVKLIDFGASKYATYLHSKSLSTVVKSGYSPEEQYRSHGNQGPWTDVYAISATLYRLITGEVPVDAQDRKNINEPENILKKPSELGIEIPENVETAIMNGLNVYAKNRYQTAKEFADDLVSLVPVPRKKEEIKRERDGRLSKKAIIGMVSGIGAAVAILIVLLSTGTLQRLSAERLPNVIEMSVEQAAEALKPYGYVYSTDETEAENKIRIEDTVYDSSIPENMILSQSPNAGSKIDTDKYPDVYLVLSAGAREVYLPGTSYVGMLKEDVISQIEGLGLVVNIQEAKSDEFAAGYVCAQQFEPGTKLREGDEITITVSTGSDDTEKKATVVPEVVGKTQEEATDILNNAKLYIAVETEYSDKVPKNYVISQTPPAGSEAVTNETIVTVVVSKGSKADETTRVPNVTNRKLANAQNMLKSAGLNYKVEYAYSNNIAQGTVVSQSIKAETEVKLGTTVTITVSKGAKNDSNAQKEQATERTTAATTTTATTTDGRITLQNVTGLSESAAKSKLSGCNVSVTYGYSNRVAKGNVIQQSPAAGTKVNKGSNVSIVVSAGTKESNFSAWSTSKPTGNVIVEEKTQYRTISQEKVYGSWSGAKTSTNTKPSSTASTEVKITNTTYHYYHVISYYHLTGEGYGSWVDSAAPAGATGAVTHRTTSNTPFASSPIGDAGNRGSEAKKGTRCTCSGGNNGQCGYTHWWLEKTVYTYQTRSVTTQTVYGNWSFTKTSEQCETRTVYRSCPNYKSY